MSMKKIWKIVAVSCVASVLACHASAVSTSASSAVLIEAESGRILYEQEADEERLIASITKIMTALVALEHGDVNEVYTVTAQDMAEGSSMYLKPGEELTLEELLYGLMLASGNDAALAVAHCVSGDLDTFVALMNDTARTIGMEHSSFANPNGLDAEGHYSSAYDMAILASHALANETFRRIVSTSSITIDDRYLKNHNKLLDMCDGCVGVKTGFTKAAGRTLVTAAQRQGMTLVCVTLNDGNDWNDHTNLFDYGFSTYHLSTPVAAGQILADIPVRCGTVRSLKLAADRDISFPVKEGEKLSLQIRLPASVPAPVIPGQTVGTVSAFLDGTEVMTVDLVATEAAARAAEEEKSGFFERLFN